MTSLNVPDTQKDKSPSERNAEDLYSVLVKVFPFILVMWSLAESAFTPRSISVPARKNAAPWRRCSLVPPAVRKSSGVNF